MPEKLPGLIKTISLSAASYKGTNTTIDPTYINYFFGNNGTGKSTLAEAIKSGSGITFSSGWNPQDYQTLVFDQDFIDNNMRSYHNLPGVFTVNEVNGDIQNKIDELVADKEDASKKLTTASDTEKSLKSDKEKLASDFQVDCWNKTSDLRKTFEKALGGKRGSKKVFADALLGVATPTEHNIPDLTREYTAAFSSNAKTYQSFQVVDNTSVLDTVPGSEILNVAIVNSSDTQLAEFFKKIGSIQWVRQGHEQFHKFSGDRCPYCSQKLPEKFEETLATSFDNQYEENIRKLNTFLSDYRDTANHLYIPLEKIPEELYPEIQIKTYNDKLAVLKATISQNIDLIKEKQSEPSRTVTLTPVEPILQDLSDIISGFNEMISKNNAIVNTGPKKKTNCTNAVLEHMAYHLKDVIEKYNTDKKNLDKKIKTQADEISKLTTQISDNETEIRNLSKQTVETESAMNNINSLLKDSGFQGFEMRPHKQQSADFTKSSQIWLHSYEVVRTETGLVAERLSEGEKNFIAFLYFLQLIHGSSDSEGGRKDKIVVIDDPVSSMDSKALFIVGAQVRKMVAICRNNADSRNPIVKGNYIKQIFILTHNAYFHREVTQEYADKWEFVSFYLIRKINNHSSIKPCECQNPDCPSEQMNVNPVKNSYATLWDEFKELQSTLPLMNVIRRILDYYFIQLCGYSGSDLHQRILVDHKDDFIHDENGNEDYSKYDLALAMLSYIATSTSEINDGMNFIDDVIDPELCKTTFKMIFEYMNQIQHYNMMMNTK